MDLIEQALKQEETGAQQYYAREIHTLNDVQRKELRHKLALLQKAGAKYPLRWAMSEVTGNSAQVARFLVLQHMLGIVEDIEGNLDMANDIDEVYDLKVLETATKLEELIGKDTLHRFLKSYTTGVMWQVSMMLDDGNYNTDGLPMWYLAESTPDGESTGRGVFALHEDMMGLEDIVIKKNNDN